MRSGIQMKKKLPLTSKQLSMMAIAFGYNFFVYYTGKAVQVRREQVDMSIPLDDHIPLISWNVLIYLASYAFWVVNYFLAMRQEDDETKRFFTAHMIGETVCFLFFLLLPTTMQRPEITGKGPMNEIMRMLYKADTPDTMFPSIHCLLSWYSWIGVRRNPSIPKPYKAFSLAFALAVCVSTVTVKQHVFVDTIAGAALAEGSYRIAGKLFPVKKK